MDLTASIAARVPCCTHCTSPNPEGHAIPCRRCPLTTRQQVWLRELAGWRRSPYKFLARFATDNDTPDKGDPR